MSSIPAPKKAVVKASLFDRLGGVQAVGAAVEEFYSRILADPKLAYFFDDTRMATLKMHQLKFFKTAFTEIPDDFDVVAYLTERHVKLFAHKGLNETHFDLVAAHFVGTLHHLGIPQELIDEAVSIVVPLRVIFQEAAKKYNGMSDKDIDKIDFSAEKVTVKKSIFSRMVSRICRRGVVAKTA